MECYKKVFIPFSNMFMSHTSKSSEHYSAWLLFCVCATSGHLIATHLAVDNLFVLFKLLPSFVCLRVCFFLLCVNPQYPGRAGSQPQSSVLLNKSSKLNWIWAQPPFSLFNCFSLIRNILCLLICSVLIYCCLVLFPSPAFLHCFGHYTWAH